MYSQIQIYEVCMVREKEGMIGLRRKLKAQFTAMIVSGCKALGRFRGYTFLA